MVEKQAKKQKAKQELDQWHAQRKREIEQRNKMNIDEEQRYKENVAKERKGNNPWERVISNCEMNANNYVGGKDVSRMRQAMIARKADITKAGGMKKPL